MTASKRKLAAKRKLRLEALAKQRINSLSGWGGIESENNNLYKGRQINLKREPVVSEIQRHSEKSFIFNPTVLICYVLGLVWIKMKLYNIEEEENNSKSNLFAPRWFLRIHFQFRRCSFSHNSDFKLVHFPDTIFSKAQDENGVRKGKHKYINSPYSHFLLFNESLQRRGILNL